MLLGQTLGLWCGGWWRGRWLRASRRTNGAVDGKSGGCPIDAGGTILIESRQGQTPIPAPVALGIVHDGERIVIRHWAPIVVLEAGPRLRTYVLMAKSQGMS